MAVTTELSSSLPNFGFAVSMHDKTVNRGPRRDGRGSRRVLRLHFDGLFPFHPLPHGNFYDIFLSMYREMSSILLYICCKPRNNFQ